MAQKARVANYKKVDVKSMIKNLGDSKVIGVVNMENLPASALARIRSQIRKDAIIYMSKRRLMTIAVKEAAKDKKGLENLIPQLKGMPAFIFTDSDPFKIARLFKKSRSPAPIKPGQTAPNDLIIPKGPTPFTPGPIISELSAVGIKTGVEGGKVTIREDSLIVEAGSVVTQKQSEILAKFGIEPMEIGIQLVAVYDEGLIYDSRVLEISPESYLQMISQASRDSLALALELKYMTKDTAEVLVAKAFKEAKALALSQGIFADLIAKDLLALADAQASALQGKLNI
ncbi:MAG TPA: 50S ribosomal protein L10 [Candidatus Nanoarchaeia archaeon]|nr:50S ribosomal protein L10 [Candidatus Nanoarchaeia archaeon]